MMKWTSGLTTKAFYILLLSVAMFIVAMPFSADIQKMMMKRFHWRDSSFLRWSLLQFIPSMYSFSNRIEIIPGNSSLQVNHFPIRIVTFHPKVRKFLAENDGDYRVILTSHYRGTKLETVYAVSRQSPYLFLHYVENQP